MQAPGCSRGGGSPEGGPSILVTSSKGTRPCSEPSESTLPLRFPVLLAQSSSAPPSDGPSGSQRLPQSVCGECQDREERNDTFSLPPPLTSFLQRTFSSPGEPPRLNLALVLRGLRHRHLCCGTMGHRILSRGQNQELFCPSHSPEVDWTALAPSPQFPLPRSWLVLQMGE